MRPRSGQGTGRLLGAEDVAKFDRDGFLVIEDVGHEDAVLEGAIDDLRGRYLEAGAEQERDGVIYSSHRITHAWKISGNVKALALNERFLGMLEELYGRKPLVYHTLNFPFGTQQAAHSDAVHFNSTPAGYMCGVWVALEDIDMDNGPLVYYPRSHKLPEVALSDLATEGAPTPYATYERHVVDLIDSSAFRPQYGTIRKGQALIWASNLLHGGAPLRDETRSRHSQVTHYFFEGCEYYSPRASTESGVAWLRPSSSESPDPRIPIWINS